MGLMSTTSVRLSQDDENLLDELAPTFGGRSNTIRRALRLLSAEVKRHEALEEFLAAWDMEADPLDAAPVSAMAERYGL